MIGYSENWTAEAAELLAIEGAQCKITTRQGRQLQLGPDGALIELADIDPFHDFPLTVGKEARIQRWTLRRQGFVHQLVTLARYMAVNADACVICVLHAGRTALDRGWEAPSIQW